MTWRWRVTLACCLSIAASCGGSGSTPTNPSNGTGGSTTNSISVGDDFFNPKSTTIAIGTTVTWTWTGSVSHNVTFDDGVKSGTMATGTFTRAFAAAGTFNYHCTIHGAAMSGSIIVQ